MDARGVVVVFGAGAMGSIGHAAAVEVARQGATVVVTDIVRPRSAIPEVETEVGWRGLDSVVDEIASKGGQVLALNCDVTDRSQLAETFERAQTLGLLRGVVNATRAPIAKAVPAIEEDDGYWNLSFAVNVNGARLCATAAAKAMMAAGQGGSIVHISSIAGQHPVSGRAAYCTSKAALQMLTRCLAMDLAPHGIRVNAVLPGIISTNRVDPEEREQAIAQGLSHAEYRSRVLEAQSGGIPMKRPGRAEEVATTIGFLLSDSSSYVTGELIAVAGGAVSPYGSHAPLQAAQNLMSRNAS